MNTLKVCLKVLWAAAVSALLLSFTLLAQFDTATVVGTIRDAQRLPLRGGIVTITNTQTGVVQTSVTNDSGDYQFFNIKAGTYTVSAEAKGFKRVEASAFTVTVNARQRVDLELPVGTVTETVDVTAAAAQLETDSSSRGTVVGNQQIVNLPLNGRAYADLALLVPGVRKSNLAYGSTPRDASFNVNGMRSSQNNFVVDGVDNNAYGTSNQGFSNQVVQPSPDAVQEFRVETSNYSAEFGRAGGAIVNVSVKSGSNQYHGAVYEFLRNTSLNATGFFKPVQNQKPVLIQNQYGAAFGGPIKKDKSFFFADFEGYRRVEKTIMFATIPTVDQRNGIFSTTVQNPYTGAVYSPGQLPSAEITRFAKTVFGYLPDPNLPGLSNNYQSLPTQPTNIDKGDGRYDQYFGSKLTGFVRYSHRLSNQLVPSAIPGLAGGNSNGNTRVLNYQTAGGLTYTLSPVSVLEFRVGIGKTEGGKTPLFVGTPSVASQLGLPNYPTDPRYTGGLYQQSISGYTTLGTQTSNPQFQDPFLVNPKVNYSRIMGRHTLKAGYEYQLLNTDIDDFNPKAGSDAYSGRFSKVAGTSNNNEQYLADFLFGARSKYELNNAVIVNLRQRMHFFYVQDDWKVSPKLVINAGVRYEYSTPQWEAQDRISNFDPVNVKLLQATDGGIYDRSLVHPDRNNFAPRLGIAYTLTPKTVIRSAYGISFIHFNRMGGENLLSYNLPNVLDPIINQAPLKSTSAPLPNCTGNNEVPGTCFRPTEMGFPDNFLSLSNVQQINVRANYIPSDFRTSYVQNWHFTIQRELANDWVLDIGYVGTRGVGLMILGDYNQARVNTDGTSLQARRPIQSFGYIQAAFGGGFLSYHGLQTKLEKRFSNGFYLMNSFTWSKAIDNASGHLEANNGDNSRANYRNLPADRGVSGYNQPLNNTTTVVYDLPFGKGQKFGSSWNKATDYVLGGWRLTGINTMASGNPVNLSYSPSSDFSVSGAPTYRPNVLGDPMMPEGQRDRLHWLNSANVVAPTDRTQPFGNAGRNIARAPSMFNLDLGLHKDFAVTERFTVSFRTEAFNLLNKTNFGPPNANISNTNFGTITSTYPARQLQFGLKVLF